MEIWSYQRGGCINGVGSNYGEKCFLDMDFTPALQAPYNLSLTLASELPDTLLASVNCMAEMLTF